MLSILASTVVLVGFTADVTLNSNPTTVNAAKNHKKKTKKKAKKTVKQTATSGTTPKSKYSSLGAWYLANDKYLFGRYHQQGYFYDGLVDAQSRIIDASKANNDYYKEGWIITVVNGINGPTDSELYGVNADKYNQTISLYNSGVAYLKKAPDLKGAQYFDSSNSWGTVTY